MPRYKDQSAPARPSALRVTPPSEPPAPASAWQLRVCLEWDVSGQCGYAWAEAFDDHDGTLVDLPSVELSGADVEGDVMALLHELEAFSGRVLLEPPPRRLA